MSEEEDSGSYSGLLIGLMIAGGIVLILILLAVFGAGFWFLDVGGPGPGPAKPPPVAVVEERMPAAPEVEIAPRNSPAQRLLGSWEGTTEKGSRFTLHFQENGKLEIDAWRRDDFKKPGTTTSSRWEIVAVDETVVKIRNDSIFEGAAPGPVHELRFEADNRFMVRSPRLEAGNPEDRIMRLGGCVVDGVAFRRLENKGASPE